VWRREDVSFDLEDDATFYPAVTVVFVTPVGRLSGMAEPLVDGTTLVLKGLHIHGDHGVLPNTVGAPNLRVIADVVMERMGCEESSLRVRFARLEPIRTIDRLPSGSPAAFVLTPLVDVKGLKTAPPPSN
jgi:hypothetical protein